MSFSYGIRSSNLQRLGDIWMGMTFVILIFRGTIPVANDWFIKWIIGSRMSLIVSFSNLFDMLSWPELNLDFSFLDQFKTSDGATGPRKNLRVWGRTCHGGVGWH